MTVILIFFLLLMLDGLVLYKHVYIDRMFAVFCLLSVVIIPFFNGDVWVFYKINTDE